VAPDGRRSAPEHDVCLNPPLLIPGKHLPAGALFRLAPAPKAAATPPRRSASQPWVVFTGRPFSVEQARLGRRPARWQLGSFRRGVCLFEVGEDLLDRHRVLDAGDDPDRPAAGPAGLDVDAEYPFQALRLSLIEARRSTGVGSSVPPSRDPGSPGPVWPVSPAPGTGCWEQTRHGNASG
jgi:hypothetical protein